MVEDKVGFFLRHNNDVPEVYMADISCEYDGITS